MKVRYKGYSEEHLGVSNRNYFKVGLDVSKTLNVGEYNIVLFEAGHFLWQVGWYRGI
ncbi:hypothetical protein bsdE14_02660 [Clostridium omnivorum]|uniref:Uncharacterized protein n=1 Tax=Clostridium omnivorum TaxID=1604902 RepID=A0ABQ5N0Z7_9CLOT|nr:hypothetical protein bsdE14_02660 [Clostridium sp. E14]